MDSEGSKYVRGGYLLCRKRYSRKGVTPNQLCKAKMAQSSVAAKLGNQTGLQGSTQSAIYIVTAPNKHCADATGERELGKLERETTPNLSKEEHAAGIGYVVLLPLHPSLSLAHASVNAC